MNTMYNNIGQMYASQGGEKALECSGLLDILDGLNGGLWLCPILEIES